MEKKKMSKGKKILLCVLIFVIFLILLFVIHGVRNRLIIKKLQRNFAPYADSTNYHVSTISQKTDGTSTKIDNYRKGDKKLLAIQRNDIEDTAKISMYYNGERVDMFTETKEEKLATLDTGNTSILSEKLSNGLEDDVIDVNFLIFLAKIKKTEVNGKEGYLIKNFFGSGFLYDEDDETELFYEKDTGLLVKQIFSQTKIETTFEFDNVEDSVFIEPNIGEYKLNYNP